MQILDQVASNQNLVQALPFQQADVNFYENAMPKNTMYLILIDESLSMSNPDEYTLKTPWENVIIAA